jgi:hypothetical protein
LDPDPHGSALMEAAGSRSGSAINMRILIQVYIALKFYFLNGLFEAFDNVKPKKKVLKITEIR